MNKMLDKDIARLEAALPFCGRASSAVRLVISLLRLQKEDEKIDPDIWEITNQVLADAMDETKQAVTKAKALSKDPHAAAWMQANGNPAYGAKINVKLAYKILQRAKTNVSATLDVKP